MDTVYNNSSTGPFMQTFKFLSYSFMFIIYQEVKSSSAMVEGLDLLETILGKELFSKEVEVLKTDRGSEFIDANGFEMHYVTTNRERYRIYKSDPKDCEGCPFLSQCTKSKNQEKVITRHVWESYKEEANHIRHTDEWKKIYPQRKETIERVFADAKEKHGMRYTKLRGLQKIKMEVSLIFSCMNLKKLANWIWRDTSGLVRRTPILMNFHIFYLYIIKMVPFVLVIGTICLQTETSFI